MMVAAASAVATCNNFKASSGAYINSTQCKNLSPPVYNQACAETCSSTANGGCASFTYTMGGITYTEGKCVAFANCTAMKAYYAPQLASANGTWSGCSVCTTANCNTPTTAAIITSDSARSTSVTLAVAVLAFAALKLQ